MFDPFVSETIRRALQEDIGSGDITSLLTISENSRSLASFIAKQDFILAGLPFVREVFRQVDADVRITARKKEGGLVGKGERIAVLHGLSRSLLAGERVSLNILQRVSGIATLTKRYVDAVKAFSVRICDTRKTAPGLRAFEKYGVRMGGGWNHRFGLADGVLIKDNHIAAAGGVREAIALARRAHHLLKIEIEVTTLPELRSALAGGADVIMLDNMTVGQIRKAVDIVKKKALLEVSGGVSLDNVVEFASTGIDIISIGALTHSARAVDISMKIDAKG